MTTPTDETLVARLAERDEDALRELHRRYAGVVFGVAARVVGDASAEEVVQDVFVTLWEKHASFDPARGAFKPWLVSIARRRASNKRRDTRSPRAEDGALEDLASDAEPPDEAHWRAHRQAVVRAAVEALPEAQRRALSLAFFDELTHEQIAKLLGTPIGTTKTRIRAALKRLAPMLVVVLAVVAITIAVRRREEDAARREEALRMVTSSDVVPLRLAPEAGAPPEAHGNYRSRPGARVAVLTTSGLPPGESYAAWAHDRDGWHRLGAVVIEKDGRSLLVADVGDAAPDELAVTRAPSADSRGTVLLHWR